MRWLTGDWHALLPQPWSSAALVLVAVLCGGIVGVERTRKQKAVGFRTLGLVSLGSTVFTMVSAALDYRTPIAGNVVSGIGFLGAGVILRGPFGITGLTSAATIWAMAAVGMTVSYAGAGLALSVFQLTAMVPSSLGEQRYIGPCRYRHAVVTFDAHGGKSAVRIEEVLDEFDVLPSDQQFLLPVVTPDDTAHAPQTGRVRVRYCSAHRHHREFLAYLATLAEVTEIRRDPLETPAQERL